MAKATASAEDLLSEAVRLLQCLAARDMARAGVPQKDIAKFLKTATAEIGPMAKGIKKAKEAT